MDRFDRIFDLHKLLSASRYPVPRARIEETLECSRATAKRIIEAMRLYLDAPIKYDRRLNGYFYDHSEGEIYELPGLWFNASELHALLSVQQLLADIEGGLLEKQLAPLRERIERLLQLQGADGEQIGRRVRILRMAARPASEHFQTIAGATMQRRRLRLGYRRRGDAQLSEREVSPQRLVHYRDNWYLDAWCHLREGLRTFALDAVQSARLLDGEALEIADAELDAHYGAAYGIFSGPASHIAVLRFRPERARWVASENWHPQQESAWLEDGRYELRIPYGDPRELLMDILKHGAEVEVVEPPALREAVAENLRKAIAHY